LEPVLGDGRGDDQRGLEERLLEEYCAQLPACTGQTVPEGFQLSWNIEPEGPDGEDGDVDTSGRCFAVVELEMLGVPHKLAGATKATAREARADTARRALWYLQCPGYEEAFEAEKLVGRGAAGKTPAEVGEMPSPPGDWVCDGSSPEALEEAKRKTIVMRVQNRLQQEFARQLQPGQGVWEWTYMADPNDEQWPPLFQAKVAIPALDKEFVGDWVRGQRDAQIDAIAKVSSYLDESGCLGGEQQKGKAGQRKGHAEAA
jgi:hypothetical protein